MLVAALTIVGFVLRLPGQGNSLFADELATYYGVALHSLSGTIHSLDTHTWDLNPPLFDITAWIGWHLWGHSVESLRWMSLFAGTASVPLTYLLGRKRVGRRAGLIGAALITLSPFMIYFSSEARSFALLTCLSLTSSLTLVRAVETRHWAWWAGFSVSACLAMYTQYTSIFVLSVLFAWAFLVHSQARRALVLATAAAVVLYLPWLPGLRNQEKSTLVNQIGDLNPFGLHAIRIDLGRLLLGGPFEPLSWVPGSAGLAVIAAAAAVIVAGYAYRVARGGWTLASVRLPDANVWLVVALAAAAPVGCAVYSLFAPSVWEPKDLISSLPALALVAGFIVSRAPRPAMVIGLSLLLIGYGIGASQVIRPSRTVRPDYDAAARYIDRTAGRAAPIVELPFLSPAPLNAMEVAVRLTTPSGSRPHQVLRIGEAPLSAVLASPPGMPPPPPPSIFAARQAARLATGGSVFLVTLGGPPTWFLAEGRQRGPGSPTDTGLLGFVRNLPARFRLVGRRTFPGIFPVVVYKFTDTAQ